MIDNVLIVDTETTGLRPDNGDKVIEIAAILYNIKHKTVLQNFSTLFPCEANPVEDINGIKAEATRASFALETVNAHLLAMVRHSDAIVAHNAEFDKKFIRTLFIWNEYSQLPWICTKKDFKWPMKLYRNRLQDVCQGIGVPYVDAHRALNDCRLIAECFNKVSDLQQRIDDALDTSRTSNGFGMMGNQYA